MKLFLDRLVYKLGSNWILSILAFILIIVVLLTTVSSVIGMALQEPFIFNTLEEVNFYQEFDEIYIQENFDNIEEAPHGQRTINYLLSEIDRVKVLQDNAEKLVPEVIEYLKGDTTSLNLVVSVGVLEKELKNQLGDYDSFIRILEIEAPEQAGILRRLPEEYQRNFHGIIKDNLIEQIRLPEELPLRYLMVEDDILKVLQSSREGINQLQDLIAVSLPAIAGILVLMLFLGRVRGLLFTGGSFTFAGVINLILINLLNFESVIVRFTNITRGEELFGNILEAVSTLSVPFAYRYVILGITCIVISILIHFFSKKWQSKGL